jgi:hypothetical protein
MAQLNQSDRPIAATVQVGGEVAQDSIGVFVVFIDEGGKIALRVEHEVPSSWTLIGRGARRNVFVLLVLPRVSRRLVGEPKIVGRDRSLSGPPRRHAAMVPVV